MRHLTFLSLILPLTLFPRAGQCHVAHDDVDSLHGLTQYSVRASLQGVIGTKKSVLMTDDQVKQFSRETEKQIYDQLKKSGLNVPNQGSSPAGALRIDINIVGTDEAKSCYYVVYQLHVYQPVTLQRDRFSLIAATYERQGMGSITDFKQIPEGITNMVSVFINEYNQANHIGSVKSVL